MADDEIEVQAIACLACGSADKLRSDADRVRDEGGGRWPAWEPGLVGVECPVCMSTTTWATEPVSLAEFEAMQNEVEEG